MVKDGLVSGRVDKTLIAKAKEQNLNISEAIEEALKEKTSTREKSPIVVVEKYGILFDARNFIVARKNTSISQTDNLGREFDAQTYSFHPNIHQALINLSNRLLTDKLKVTCKDNPLELKELARIIQDHHKWFVDLVKGI